MACRRFAVSAGPLVEVSGPESVCPVWPGMEQTSAGGVRSTDAQGREPGFPSHLICTDRRSGCTLPKSAVVLGLSSEYHPGQHTQGGRSMEEDRKKQIATFRFGVIHDLVGHVALEPGEQERLIRDKCDRKWVIPFSDKTRITRSTILRWVKLYKDSGGKLEALANHDRSDTGRSRAIDEETGLALIGLRGELPKATVARLIREMNKRRLVSPGITLTVTTVHRFLKANGLMKGAAPALEDRRKFEAELPNDLWQSDCMHGPSVEHEGKKRKTYLLAFIDDHSRLVPHAEFYLTESLPSYLKALEEALLTRGLPRKIYTDNGSAFRSHHLEHVTASLGIALIHAQPYKPQGKGKIERFFRTVRGDFLSCFTGATLADLNQALFFWLSDIYHQRVHSSTGQTPFARFTSRMECLREAPHNLRDYFRKAARRKVAKDRTVSLDGKIFEAPVPLTGKQVTLLFHPEEPERAEILFKGESYGSLVPVNLAVNCRAKRDRNNNLQVESSDSPRHYKGGSLWGKGDDR
jgi:putative transposase